MPIQEPAWRKRTRPCPFFSQGRCLFADSCNFLHDVKVKSTADQPLLAPVHTKHHLLPSKPVPGPPSVVVDAASPRSANLAGPESRASPIQDSSRYSGLLSVLSDVIGPPAAIPGDTDSQFRTTSIILSSPQGTAHDCTLVPLGSDTGSQSTNGVVDAEREQCASGSAELSSILQPDGTGTLVDPFACQVEAFFPETHSSPAAESFPVPVAEELFDGNRTPHCVEETVGESQEEDGDEESDDYEEENPTVVVSNRQSTSSSFTGASLLASPRNTESSVASPVDVGAVDLLSPVELSAKLQPFPMPSLASKIGRTDSIDSGYADGDGWASPIPFPRSPPGGFRSSAIFLPHLRQESRPSPALRDEGIPGGDDTLRPIPYNPIEITVGEVEPSGALGGNEDTAYAILDAYDASGFEEQAERETCNPSQLEVAIVTADKVEKGDELSEGPAVTHNPWYCPEHLRPTKGHDLDSCNQSSLISDDNLSFKTALSTQASYEDFNITSKVSTVDVSSVSGCSVHNTSLSVLSHYDDACEFLEPPAVSSDKCDPLQIGVTPCMASQIDATVVSDVLVPEEFLFPEVVVIDSDALFASVRADDLQGPDPQTVFTPRALMSSASHSDRSPVSTPPLDTSHSLSSDKNVLGDLPACTYDTREFTRDETVTPRERFSGAFDFNNHSPASSSAAPYGSPLVLSSAPHSVDDPPEFASKHAAPRKHSFDISPRDVFPLKSSPWNSYSPSSSKDIGVSTPENAALQAPSPGVPIVDQCSPKLSSPTKCSESPPLIEDILSYAHENVDGEDNDIAIPWKHMSSALRSINHHPEPRLSTESSRSSSSFTGALGELPSTGHFEELAAGHVVSQECLSGVLDLGKPPSESSPLAEDSHSTPSFEDVALSSASLEVDGDDGRFSDFTTLHDSSGSVTRVADQSSPEDTSLSDEIIGSFDSESISFIQQLSFPLPPPFLPAEFVGNSTVAGDGDAPVATEAWAVLQNAESPRILSSADLTEKAGLSQLPSLGSPVSTADFTLRRNRAASDLTVKGKSSPVAVPKDVSYTLESPSLPLEQPDQSGHVRTLYEQYFGDGTSDDRTEFFRHADESAVPANASTHVGEPSQDIRLQSPDTASRAFQRVSSPCSDGRRSNPSTHSPSSETIFRPLLTGRKSLLRSSLSELIPKECPTSVKKSSPTHRPVRLQSREIGGTMIPLGFRRQKPQSAVIQSLQGVPQPLPAMLPVSELRQALRIRTDIVKDSSRGCSSAIQASSTTQSPLVVKSMSAPPTGGLKELHLTSLVNKRSSILSTNSSSVASSILSLDHIFHSSTPQSPSVSSASSFSCNSLLSSSRDQIPEQVHHTLKRSSSNPLILQSASDVYFASHSPSTRSDSRSVSAPIQPWRLSHYRAGSRNYSSNDVTRRSSRRTSTLSHSYVVGEEPDIDEEDSTATRLIQSRLADERTNPGSVLVAPVHAIATPKPTLLFAIASDDVNHVHQVLESGEAGPNDSVGPQSALAFTLTNDKLTHKQEIVKALLAYGANPSALRNPTLNPAPHKEDSGGPNAPPPETTLEGMDPATRYFVSRADAPHTRQTSQLIYRSFFRPLTRVRYDVIGQDWALEQLFRVLGMHSQKLAVAPIVVLLCGPSGHGKSLLARKFGSLLGIPTHTVNMTTLRSAYDIWQSYSMSPYEEPSSCTLTEFLIENEGKRCVVVLDEIEKVEDQKVLWSLLMPWELGRCSWEAGKRHVDVRDVIWLGTSNIGHELVFEHHENRAEPDSRMSREDYLELTDMLRPRVSHCLGASLISRVTTVLPFVPFTLDEKKAIAAEAVYALGGDTSKIMSPHDVESVVLRALPSYRPNEGARSLHRAVSNILVDAI